MVLEPLSTIGTDNSSIVSHLWLVRTMDATLPFVDKCDKIAHLTLTAAYYRDDPQRMQSVFKRACAWNFVRQQTFSRSRRVRMRIALGYLFVMYVDFSINCQVCTKGMRFCKCEKLYGGSGCAELWPGHIPFLPYHGSMPKYVFLKSG